jgi:hypothetical protein
MKKILLLILALFSFFAVLMMYSCAIPTEATKDNIVIEDSLQLRGGTIISGTVTDSQTNEPISRANVVVYSKPIRRETDIYGQFQIVDIGDGTYILQIFCVGYEQKTITDIRVIPNRMIKLNIKLEPRRLDR